MNKAQAWIIIVLPMIHTSIGEFVLVDRGMKPYLANSMALTFYATVATNRAGEDLSTLTLRLQMMLCCQILLNHKNNDPSPVLSGLETNPNWDCQSMKIYSGLAFHIHPNQTRTLTAFFLNKHVLNRKGVCTFKIHDVDSIPPFSINFDTRITKDEKDRPSAGHSKIPGAKACGSLDEDPLRNCEPIDCVGKYTGFRSFFSSQKRVCEPTPNCEAQSITESEINLTEIVRQEQHPIMVLDLKTNQCINVSLQSHGEKALVKSRSADDDESKGGDQNETPSVQAFAAAYGLTLTKLGIALILTLTFVLVVCVVINFCFGCLCGFYSVRTRRHPKQDCPEHKYQPLPIVSADNNDDNPPESASRVIEEIKDRREMRSKQNQGYEETRPGPEMPAPSSKAPTAPKSGTPPTISTPNRQTPPKTPSPPAKTPTPVNTPPQPTTATGNLHSSGIKKLPNVLQFLQQLQNFRQKSLKKGSNDYIDMSHVYGRSSKVVRSLDTESTISFESTYNNNNNNNESTRNCQNDFVEIPDANTRLINVGITPRFNQVIHKIQESQEEGEDGLRRVNVNKQQAKLAFQKNLQRANELQNEKINVITKHLTTLKDRTGDLTKSANYYCHNSSAQREADHQQKGLPTEVELPSWASVTAFDTMDSTYRQEMAEAMTFMKQLENQRCSSQDILQSSSNQGSPQLIRRIKEEPPIPMSMIYEGLKKFNDVSTDIQQNGSHLVSGVTMSQNYKQEFGFPNFQATPSSKQESRNQCVQASTSHDDLPSKTNCYQLHQKTAGPSNVVEKPPRSNFTVPSSSLNNNCTSTALSSSDKMVPSTTKSVSLSPVKEEKGGVCKFFELPGFVHNLTVDAQKTNAAAKIYQSALRLQQEVHRTGSDVSISGSNIQNFSCSDLHLVKKLRHGDSSYELTSSKEFEVNEQEEEAEEAHHRTNVNNVFKIMQEINSEHLVHSPPTMTSSELSCDGSSMSSDLPTSVLKHEKDFWDNEFQPEQIQPHQALQRPSWIDDFVHMPEKTRKK